MAAKTTLEQKTNFTQDHSEYLHPRHGYQPQRRATKKKKNYNSIPKKRRDKNYQKLKIQTQITMRKLPSSNKTNRIALSWK
jgi:hypothetical protein